MKKLTVFALTLAMTASLLVGCGSGETTDVSSEVETTEKETEETLEEAAEETEEAAEEAVDEAASDGTVYKIGVIQLTEHAALDAANEGFVAALNDSGIQYEIDQQNAQNDQSACQTIAAKLVADGDDLILAIATPAAQAAAAETTEIPIVGTAITDFVDAGLVNDSNAPGTNVTGTSDLTPVAEQIDLLKKLLPETKTVGILYCSAESNSAFQADLAVKACEEAGLSSEVFTVASSNEIQTVVESMVGKVDAIYAPTDNTIAAGMATVAMVANDNNLPVICGESGMVDAGGLATYGIDYYQLGYLAGQQAVSILKGETNVSETPIGYLSAEQCELTTNAETAAALNVDLTVLDNE